MAASTSTHRRLTARAAPVSLAETILRMMPRGMEALWLLAAGLVPVLFAPSEVMVFVDVPKVALLRVLAGVMALLWIIEWGFQPPASARSTEGLWSRFRTWTREDPSRWVLVAAALFVAANLLSTMFSPALALSVWGGNPGRDGYGLYNTVSHTLIFAVIATHLRTRPQVWRLLGTIAAAVTVASLYALLQHYGVDPLAQGDSSRVPSSFGNPLFAASYLVMGLPVTMGLAVVCWVRTRSVWWSAAWVLVMSVQLMAVSFTLSRGPWVALAAGSLIWLTLVGLACRRQGLFAAIVGLGAAAAVVFAVVTISDSVMARNDGSRSRVVNRASSILTEVTDKGVSGRLSIWRRSASLIADRPWLEPTGLGLAVARHLVGYGPDVFLYALPLTWDEDALEPVNANAHNYPIHLAVELGPLGLVSYALLVASILICGISMLRGRGSLDTSLRLVVASLLAVICVRIVDQLTGVPRISDLALFWTIAGLVAALPSVSRSRHGIVDTRESVATPRRTRVSLELGIGAPAWRYLIALALVAAIIVGTWDKSAGYVRAAYLGSASVRTLHDGDLLSSLEIMDRAIAAAPDVEFYYLARAQLMDSFTTDSPAARIEVAEAKYALTVQALKANPLSHDATQKSAALAMRLVELGRTEYATEAVELYERLVRLLPGYEKAYVDLATAHLVLGRPQRALSTLSAYASFTDGSAEPSATALYIKGIAHKELGQVEDAKSSLQEYVRRTPDGPYAQAACDTLAGLYAPQIDRSEPEVCPTP